MEGLATPPASSYCWRHPHLSRPELATTSPLSQSTPPLLPVGTARVSTGTGVGDAQPSQAAVALSARIGELLAMFDRSGVVTAVRVETLPDGRAGYALQLAPEAPPLRGTPPPPLGSLVQVVSQIAEMVAQAQNAGLVLRGVVGVSNAVAAGRSEVALLGTLAQAILSRAEGVVPPVLTSIIRRAVNPEAANPYTSVNEMRGDLSRLQRTIPAPTSGGMHAFSRAAQSLGALEFPGVISVNGVLTLSDGRMGYGLRMLPDASVPNALPFGAIGDVMALMRAITDAVAQGRDAGLVLRELSMQGVTLPLTGVDARPELTALGTIFRELMVLTQTQTQTPLAAPLAAMIQRSLDPDSPERYEEIAQLQADLAAQHQLARLLPEPTTQRTENVIKSVVLRRVWFLLITALIVIAVLVFARR